jgi:Bacteriophytochrome (light-regulated signal transduction histidine kinase)
MVVTNTVIQKTFEGLIAATIVFLASTGAISFISYRLMELNGWTLHTHQVIQELKDALTALLDVETGDRGFVIARDPKFLAPYNSGRVAVFRHLDKVKELTIDNPEQQKLIGPLRETAQEKVAFAASTLEVPSSESFKIVASGKGTEIMDRFRRQIFVMMENENSLLTKRTSELEQTQQMLWLGAGVLTLSGSGILVWVFSITRAAIEKEKQRVAILDALNADLQSEIEQRKRTEKALKDATIKLTSSNADLQKFAYVASHDLQEPLRAVSGFVTLIANKHGKTLDDETLAWINHAVEGSSRMRTLINDLLAYARVESRGKELQKVDTNKALTVAKRDLSVAIEESQAEIVSDDLPEVIGEESQLTQVFQNLIANAIKFHATEKPVVRIKVKDDDDNWLFSVTDNGIGFDEEHAERIFVIFQRLHGREEYKGTGIGLALCKKIIERHGGRIWAKSERGKGSTFFFTIPKMGEGNEGNTVGQNSDGGG